MLLIALCRMDWKWGLDVAEFLLDGVSGWVVERSGWKWIAG